jgi:hypothetical protein
MDRLTAKAERLMQSTANLEKIVEAAQPLYASLDETQKHKFITLERMLVPERGLFAKEQHSAELRSPLRISLGLSPRSSRGSARWA